MAKVMIVDDSQIMRMNLKSIFRQLGHEVISEVENGRVAASEYYKYTPDLVTMDITMPIMNGIDATKEIIAKHPEAKIIVISALNQKNMVFEALESGAKNYILKPVTIEKIENVLKEVLGNETKSNASSDKSESENREPFTIENVNGVFMVNFNKVLGEKEINMLRTNIQSFYIIKPLKILLNMINIKNGDEDFVLSLKNIVDGIKKNNGIVGIATTQAEQYLRLDIPKEKIFSTRADAVL